MPLLRTIWSYSGGLILFLLSNVLASLLLPAGVLYGIISGFWKHRARTGIKSANKKLQVLAVAIDIYGNVACAELFNHLLIHRDSPYRFGAHGQTISAVLGLNLLNNSLSKTGHLLDDILDFFDDGHSIKAAQAWRNKQV